jgi:Domain of unknown function (DUF4259)
VVAEVMMMAHPRSEVGTLSDKSNYEMLWVGRSSDHGSAEMLAHANAAILETARMGTWGPGPFDNDAATDWYLELIETSDLWLIEEALHTDGIEDEFFVFPDMDVIEAACEVVLGLLMPDDFEQRSKAGPKHVDPLVDGLGAFRDLKDRPSVVNFSIPRELIDWVNQHRHLDVRPLLVPANVILNYVKGSGEAFYDGYFRKEEAKEAWLSYIDDLNGRVGEAIQA